MVFKQNLQVERQRPLIDVLHVQLHPALEWNAAAAHHLPQAGDPRLDAEAPAMPRSIEGFVVTYRQRPWTDQAHIAHKNVDELRQLVDAGFAQEAADRRDARIIANLEYRAADLVQVFQTGELPFRIGNHGAKFVEPEATLVDTHALLGEKYGAG